MTPPFSIRIATAQDNELLAFLGQQTFSEAFAAANTPEDMAAYLTTAFSPELQAAELADQHTIFWLVLVQELPVGYVKLFTNPAEAGGPNQKVLRIARLYLLQAWCGQGIGSKLLNNCLHYARENNFTSVRLTVWEHNTGALALYQKFGFTIVGDEDFILGQDVQHDYIMERVL